MRRVALALMLTATVAFLVSSVTFALSGGPQGVMLSLAGDLPFASGARGWPDLPALLPVPPPDPSPPPALARPSGKALQLLLVLVWAAVLFHAIRASFRVRAAALGIRQQERSGTPDRPAEMLAMAGALTGAAAWPWIADRSAIAGMLAAGATSAFSILAALGDAGPAPEVPRRTSVGIFAGWTVVSLYASFAAVLTGQLGVSATLAAVIAVGFLLVTAINVQFRLGPMIGFSLAIMWAMIGIAAQSVGADLSVTLAAVAAIAGLAAVMVRVMS
ncbi:hypothetical protein GI374_06055 [Paracoccus sp. S-4012]|uniref:hypothetical protein n=1 Tax=Paracoccus sp. S-4012 TaxID=2665648 RepID=UPI0012B01A53|nr:hypothetical protein [Paracoccus sp. S-4012]MRX50020.1 hypothetical protein [Paracoccus sp. S-4012]